MDIDFFVVGSQRCGTTWVDAVLRSTGRVLLPENKQTYYFDRNHANGLSWYFDQYRQDGQDKYDLTGEVATGYCLDGAINRLAETFPNVKLILLVREPVSRAYSNYCKRREDYDAEQTFEQALTTDNDLIERGLYGDMLKRMRVLFPESQIKVMYFEDLQNKPAIFVQDMFDFLELDSTFDKSLLGQNINSSIFEKLIRVAKKYHFYFIVIIIKKLGLTNFFRKLIYMFRNVKNKDVNIDRSKFEKYFLESNIKLSDYTNRSWR